MHGPVDDTPLLTDAPPTVRRSGFVRRAAMRPRKVLVRLHRWLGIGLFAWLVVLGLTGAWLAVHHSVEGWIHPDRYDASPGDVGPDAAMAAAAEVMPEGTSVYGVVLPTNGRGVYLVWGEHAAPEPQDEGTPAAEPTYYEAFVDPGTGEVNDLVNESEGATHWLYRGHEYLWQDQGIFGVFDPEDGWCRAGADGHEPGGVKGIACDVIPDGMDLVAWFAMGFLVLLLSGFYLWYWPGVRRWATALVIKRGRGRFALHMSLHKVVGLVVWAPLVVVAFTGAAFAFPNLSGWFENASPAQRDFSLWTHPEDLTSSPKDGREPIGFDRAAEIYRDEFPDRRVNNIYGPGEDETGMYEAWLTRGFDPWTREGGAGNVLVTLDQYTGEVLYDGTPEGGNVFDQAWDDWSFPLHTGDFGGTATRVLWVGLGLSPLVLGVTGITMNLVRRGKRKKRVAADA
jgi:uncharacterized iron-regulated membrane protein